MAFHHHLREYYFCFRICVPYFSLSSLCVTIGIQTYVCIHTHTHKERGAERLEMRQGEGEGRQSAISVVHMYISLGMNRTNFIVTSPQPSPGT